MGSFFFFSLSLSLCTYYDFLVRNLDTSKALSIFVLNMVFSLNIGLLSTFKQHFVSLEMMLFENALQGRRISLFSCGRESVAIVLGL